MAEKRANPPTALQDSHAIPGIHNYCHRRCERCPFTERCVTFRGMQAFEARHPHAGVSGPPGTARQRVVWLLRAWRESEEIAFKQACPSQPVMNTRNVAVSALARASADPLRHLASAYACHALEFVTALGTIAPFHERPAHVNEAVATIAWYAGMVPAKIERALHGAAQSVEGNLGRDDVQNDWHGSAKAARLAIRESSKAWCALLGGQNVAAASPVARQRQLLERIDEELAARFPRAMEFVRPGFDEPGASNAGNHRASKNRGGAASNGERHKSPLRLATTAGS